jgi:hypothetical protein
VFILAAGTASLVHLDGRTFDVVKRAKYAAVASYRLEQLVTTGDDGMKIDVHDGFE